MSSRPWSVTRRGSRGFTLIELMVALVVSAIAAGGIYAAFISTSRAFTGVKAQDNTWQQARTAMTMLTQAIESAGYGLPLVDCAQVYSNNFQSSAGGLLSLSPVSAQTPTPTALNPYDPGAAPINAGVATYEIQTVTGGGPMGSAPTTFINNVPSVNSANVGVVSSMRLHAEDLFVVPLPNASCLLGQITNVNPPSTTVVFNSGARGSSYNLSGGFSAIDPAVTASQIQNANFIDLGQANFTVNNFFIGYKKIAGTNNYDLNSVPSLYMQQFTSLTNNANSQPSVELVARGVVDMQVEFGYGTQGFVTTWGTPGQQPGRNVDAVKIALLVRSTRALAGSGTTAGGRVSLFSNGPNSAIYTIPTALPANETTGCIGGNCSHYLYRVFKTVIPLRNVLWSQSP